LQLGENMTADPLPLVLKNHDQRSNMPTTFLKPSITCNSIQHKSTNNQTTNKNQYKIKKTVVYSKSKQHNTKQPTSNANASKIPGRNQTTAANTARRYGGGTQRYDCRFQR
jgi:hypothetical protein